MPADRYYTLDNPEFGVAPDGLAALSTEEQIEYITAWFYRHFEDPAQETPWNGQEGGYLYIHGGPYDADEEIRQEFEGLVSEEAIAAVVEDVTSDGTVDWAPTSNHMDRADDGFDEPIELASAAEWLELVQAGAQPEFGSRAEIDQRAVVLEKLGELEKLLEGLVPTYGGVGHNRPPGSVTDEQIAEIRQAIANIRNEMAATDPDVAVVAKAASILEKFWCWLTAKADIAVESFAKGFGNALGVAAAGALTAAAIAATVGYGDDLVDAVHGATTALSQWFNIVLRR